MNADMEVVPKGATGELYVGGVGVSRGYLNRPAMTAERFVPNPYGTETGNYILYKTGDVCRELDDGSMCFSNPPALHYSY